MFFDERLLLAE